MNIIIPLFEFVLYVLYSFLVGFVVLQFIPKEKKPTIYIPKSAIFIVLLGIIIFSLGPLIQLIFYFKDSVGLGLTIYNVVSQFEVGRAWIFMSFMSVFLWMTILVNGNKYFQAFWLLLMIMSVGYASHVASLSFWTGFISQTLHFLMVTMWVGILIHVSWFSKDNKNHVAFLKWFTPFAIICFLVIVSSGFLLMGKVVDLKDYINTWSLPYGQMLLLKHISIIPVMVFSFINGFLLRKSSRNSTFNPIRWMRVETIILLMVFTFTGIMGTLSPPHEVNLTVRSEGAANWVEKLMGNEINATPLHLHLVPSVQGLLLLIMSVLFISMIFVSFRKEISPKISLLFGFCFILSLYFGLMSMLSM